MLKRQIRKRWMNMKQQSIEKMWEEYCKKNPVAPTDYSAWAFGDSKEMADELAELVLTGMKTATASLHLFYELENEDLPYVGLHNIILNGDGDAVAIVETTSVDIIPFDEVTEEHSYLEGEGDRTLLYWREVHKDFFQRELEELDKTFDPKMLVVCERFKLVYK